MQKRRVLAKGGLFSSFTWSLIETIKYKHFAHDFPAYLTASVQNLHAH